MSNRNYGAGRKSPPRFPRIDTEIKVKGSVIDFIRYAHISPQTYYAMQSGRTQPTLSFVYAILQYTGLSFEAAFMS